MGLFDTILGRTKPVAPQLDAIFALPSAAVSLQTSLGLVTSGRAGLCWKSPSGADAQSSLDEMRDLLNVGANGHLAELSVDELGYDWAVIADPDLESQVARIHGAHSTLVDKGLGERLLCAVFDFAPKATPSDGPLQMIYLTKSGTFYPFAARENTQRDNELELRVRGFLDGELPIEKDLSKWMALWGNPVA